MAGELQPGQGLPVEVETAELWGVSRSVYREAIRTLAAKGLVESRPRLGTRVLPTKNWHLFDPDVLRWASSSTTPALREGALELHLALEPSVAGLAAVRRTQRHFDVLSEAVEAMAAHQIYSEIGQRARQRFHIELFRASANPFIVSLVPTALVAIEALVGPSLDPTTKHKEMVSGHQRILDAIAKKQARGAEVATAQLIEALQRGSK